MYGRDVKAQNLSRLQLNNIASFMTCHLHYDIKSYQCYLLCLAVHVHISSFLMGARSPGHAAVQQTCPSHVSSATQ